MTRLKVTSKAILPLKAMLILALAAVVAAGAQPAGAQEPVNEGGFVVHEWGTFTSVAGKDGKAVAWSPLTGPPELPDFVERFNIPGFKSGLRGTVRMETPVLYFYSSHRQTVYVSVAFSRGVITEWYPHASVPAEEHPTPTMLYEKRNDGGIIWESVNLEPEWTGDFVRDIHPGSRYYVARATASTPLFVRTTKGGQHEKFLFYRGVSALPAPVTATADSNGAITAGNLEDDEISDVILFERRGDRVGYRIIHGLRGETTLQPPDLNGSTDALYSDFEQILEGHGLFQAEAHAMVQTWRDSWFEEGSRLFYIVPSSFVDRMLPMKIGPAPERMVRVFVGRMEIVTPATRKAVQTALAAEDWAALAKYGRFLEPIREMISSSADGR